MLLNDLDNFLRPILGVVDYKSYIDIDNIRFTRISKEPCLYYTDVVILIDKFNFKSKNKYSYSWMTSLKGVPYVAVGNVGDYPIIPLDDVIKWIEKLFIVQINSIFNNETNLWDCNIILKCSKLKLTEKKGFKYRESSIIYCIKLLLDY